MDKGIVKLIGLRNRDIASTKSAAFSNNGSGLGYLL